MIISIPFIHTGYVSMYHIMRIMMPWLDSNTDYLWPYAFPVFLCTSVLIIMLLSQYIIYILKLICKLFLKLTGESK